MLTATVILLKIIGDYLINLNVWDVVEGDVSSLDFSQYVESLAHFLDTQQRLVAVF
jgi:energy-converting hydrogenase Eha subunit A